MQTITTTYLGPTNSRGTRIGVATSSGRVIVSWDHEQDVTENHRRAALALARKLGWSGRWVGGELADGRGMTFVNTGKLSPTFTVKPAKV